MVGSPFAAATIAPSPQDYAAVVERVDALRMFDEMLPWQNDKKTAVATGRDGIDALPDSFLDHILGFLPAHEAVQTCVLARRWRNLWKPAASLRISCIEICEEDPVTFEERRKFVDNLLRFRGFAPLERFELRFGANDPVGVEHWIQHALLCQVQMLRVENVYLYGYEIDERPLISSHHLVRLEVVRIMVNNYFCDLSSCPSLEYLEFRYCDFWCTEKISSESLKCLSMTSCSFSRNCRTLIYAPSLVSLRLDDHWCRTPCFRTLPSLHEAFVRVTNVCDDCCLDDEIQDCDFIDCYSCNEIEHDSSKCLNLDGLSKSENLSWIVESEMFILRKDLKKWPTFSKLKDIVTQREVVCGT